MKLQDPKPRRSRLGKCSSGHGLFNTNFVCRVLYRHQVNIQHQKVAGSVMHRLGILSEVLRACWMIA